MNILKEEMIPLNTENSHEAIFHSLIVCWQQQNILQRIRSAAQQPQNYKMHKDNPNKNKQNAYMKNTIKFY